MIKDIDILDNYNGSKEFSPAQEGPINRLPPEILEIIFSYLNAKDLQSAESVSRFWNRTVIDFTARKDNLPLLRKFAKFLAKNLPKNYQKERFSLLCTLHYPERAEQASFLNSLSISHFLRGFIANIAICKEQFPTFKPCAKFLEKNVRHQFQNSLCVQKIKPTVHKLKKEIANTLISLNEQDLEKLKQLSNSRFNNLQNLFNLAVINKKLKFAAGITNEVKKQKKLRKIILELAKEGFFDEAIALTSLMNPSHDIKYQTFESLAKLLKENDLIEKAIKVALMVPRELQREDILYEILEDLLAKGDFDNAIKKACTSSYGSTRSHMLWMISEELVRLKCLDKAIEVTRYFILSEDKTPYSRSVRSCNSYKSVKWCINSGDFDKAINTAAKGGSHTSSYMLFDISREIAKIGVLDKALEAADKIENIALKLYAYSEIAMIFAGIGKFEEASEVSNLIRLMTNTKKS